MPVKVIAEPTRKTYAVFPGEGFSKEIRTKVESRDPSLVPRPDDHMCFHFVDQIEVTVELDAGRIELKSGDLSPSEETYFWDTRRLEPGDMAERYKVNFDEEAFLVHQNGCIKRMSLEEFEHVVLL